MQPETLEQANKLQRKITSLDKENEQIQKALNWSDLELSIAVLQNGHHCLTRDPIKVSKAAIISLLHIQNSLNCTEIASLKLQLAEL